MPKHFDLVNFTLTDMVMCGSVLRHLGENAKAMEMVADNIVKYVYGNFIDESTGKQACVLVRVFKTQSYGSLPQELKLYVQEKLATADVNADMKSLVLLGTAGEKAEWNDRRLSSGHKAIPLPSEEVLEKIPMMRNLIKQFGMNVNTVIRPDPTIIMDMAQKTYNVFYVPDALGSPHIPAQADFVTAFGVKSVFGFGGVLPSGDAFIVIIFAKVRVSKETVEMFKPLALNVKLALLPHEERVFN